MEPPDVGCYGRQLHAALDSSGLGGYARLQVQHQAHDHVLKPEERRRSAFATACHYDLENPVRDGLAKHPSEWPFNGAIVPGYPALHPLQEDFWRKFWKLHAQARHADAGDIHRPPIG
jgi:hypothetical protein